MKKLFNLCRYQNIDMRVNESDVDEAGIVCSRARNVKN